MSKTIYASALLVDNKIKFWKVSPNKKSTVYDFYKCFYYADEDMRKYIDNPAVRVEVKAFEATDDESNDYIFRLLAPQWFKQWELIDKYVGQPPYSSAIKDKIGGVHDEGLGWNPKGHFCGECSNIDCSVCEVWLCSEKMKEKKLKIPDNLFKGFDI